MRKFVAEDSDSSAEATSNVGSKCSSNGHAVSEVMQAVSHHHHPRNIRKTVWSGVYMAMCVRMTMVVVLVLPAFQIHKVLVIQSGS